MPPLARTVLFSVLVPGSAGVVIPLLIASSTERVELGPLASLVGLALIAGGAALYVWCALSFSLVGRGTPGPWDPPTRFVARGPYAFVRNPIYLAVLGVVAGEGLTWGAPALALYAALLAVLFHLFVTQYEERDLHRRFGDEYEAYLRAVPRWIPKSWSR